MIIILYIINFNELQRLHYSVDCWVRFLLEVNRLVFIYIVWLVLVPMYDLFNNIYITHLYCNTIIGAKYTSVKQPQAILISLY